MLVCTAGNVQAEVSADEFLRSPSKEMKEQYLSAFYNAVSWYKAYIVTVEKGAGTYCAPGKLALAGPQLLQILASYVEAHPNVRLDPVGMAMFQSLVRAFPCKQ